MPSVSDPGQALVEAARDAGVDVQVVPGPSACVTALVASGIASDHFFFEGFLGRKHGERVRRLRELAMVPGALIFYESPHRIVATLQAVAEVFPQRMVAVCRELTKLHEEVLRGRAEELVGGLEARDEIRGEIALVVAPPAPEEVAAFVAGAQASSPAETQEKLEAEIREALAAGEPASALAKRLSQSTPARSVTFTLWCSLLRSKQPAVCSCSSLGFCVIINPCMYLHSGGLPPWSTPSPHFLLLRPSIT